MLVKTLVPVQGPTIPVSEITVLEGPSGSGKTAMLAEILRQTTGESIWDSTPDELLVLRDLQLASPLSEERLLAGLIVVPESEDAMTVSGLDATLSRAIEVPCRKDSWSLFRRPVLSAQAVAKSDLGQILKLRIAYVASSRLTSCIGATAAGNPLRPPEHLLHLLQHAPREVLGDLNCALAGMFDDVEVTLDDSQVVELSLRVGRVTGISDVRQRAKAFARLPRLDQLSESLQRCVAVMLICLLSKGRVLLLDAPDAGLSDFVARRLGRWLSDHCQEQQLQLFIAAGGRALLAGLAEGRGDVTVVRLRHESGRRYCSAVQPDTLRAIEQSALVRANRNSDCVRASGILLVESEVERAIYQALVDADVPGDHRLHVLQSFGPAFLLELKKTLAPLDVPIAVLTQWDLLVTPERFQETCRSVTGSDPLPAWQSVRERVAAEIEGLRDRQAMADNTREMEAFLAQLATKPADRVSLAPDMPDSIVLWREVRLKGLAAIPSETHGAVEELSDELKLHGLFLSPVGHVRHWFQDGRSPVSHHWFDNALNRIQRGACPEPLLASFREVVTWMRGRVAR